MSKETVEIYLREKSREYLKNIEAFEKKLINDKEIFSKLQEETQAFKKANPNETYEAVKKNLIGIKETHYWAFLLEQSLRHELIKLREILVMADINNIDLELEGDQLSASEEIRKQESRVFVLNKNNEVELIDNEFSKQLEGAVGVRKDDEEHLKRMYDSIPV